MTKIDFHKKQNTAQKLLIESLLNNRFFTQKMGQKTTKIPPSQEGEK